MAKEPKGGKAAAAGAEVEERADEALTTAAPEGGQASDDEENGGGTGGHDLSEEAHLASISDGEAAASAVAFDARSLVWDVRDSMLECYKHRPRPYAGLSQGEQRDVAASFEQVAQEVVRRVVETVAANGSTPVRVLLTKVTLGEKIQIAGEVKTYSEDEEDLAVGLLHSARGKHVLLTVASKDDYQQGQRTVEGEPDQPEMEFEAGAQPPADDSDVATPVPTDGVKTGDQLDGLTMRVNLKTGMVEALPEGLDPDNGDDWTDERTATPGELAAERERQADFNEEKPD